MTSADSDPNREAYTAIADAFSMMGVGAAALFAFGSLCMALGELFAKHNVGNCLYWFAMFASTVFPSWLPYVHKLQPVVYAIFGEHETTYKP